MRGCLQELDRVLTMHDQEEVRSNNRRTEWFHDEKRIATVLISLRFDAVVVGSFLPEDP